MNSGYIKFYRKAQDSSSWNRGLMYQGLMIHLLTRAVWKKSSYSGRDLLPGQFGAVLNKLADSLSVPRTTLKRMVVHLEEDGFIRVENVGHRFSIITIVNWHSYQQQSDDAWTAHGPPVVHQRTADGPPSYNEEEGKKEEEKKEEYSASAPPDAVLTPDPEPDFYLTKKKRKLSGKRLEAFNRFWEAFAYAKGKAEAADAWLDMPQLTNALVEQIISAAEREAAARPQLVASGHTPKWAQGWISGRRWEDEYEASLTPKTLEDLLAEQGIAQ